ncbi:MAG TPA: ACP phosphodiesterase [Lentimicrobium sp.]|nr:ACP phosphodiesterase [Lentimicrobium sp.]
MNFLAHLYLSSDDPESIIGNFIADHVKGKIINLYSTGIKNGILFHRAIDQFTDSNAIVKYTLLNLRPHFHKYAGVVLDMYYDHFLAKQWIRFSNEPIEEFTSRAFGIIKSSIDILPERSRYILPYMMEQNWLINYRYFEGLHDALSGIAQRTKFSSNLSNGVSHLKSNYGFYTNSFEEFFPQLIEYSKSIKQ